MSGRNAAMNYVVTVNSRTGHYIIDHLYAEDFGASFQEAAAGAQETARHAARIILAKIWTVSGIGFDKGDVTTVSIGDSGEEFDVRDLAAAAQQADHEMYAARQQRQTRSTETASTVVGVVAAPAV